MNTLELAQALLSKPSVTPEDGGCQILIADFLIQLGFKIYHYPQNKVQNLWATWGEAPYFCFAGHTDVVPPGDLKLWDSPPFTPTIRENKLYARGAADMKSAIAAMMTACARFLKQNKPNFGIAFLITSDEEGLAIDGTKAVLKILAEKQTLPRWCLVGEASADHCLGDAIKVGRRGSFHGTLKIEGKQGHVAYPDLGINAIHKACPIIDKICQIEWDSGDHLFPPTTLQFTNLNSGTGADNVIPGALEAQFNLRFSPAITTGEIQDRIQTILDQSGSQCRIDWRLSGKPFLTDIQSPFVVCVSNTIENTLNRKTDHSTTGGTSDGRFFAEYGIDVIELGPQSNSIHQVNEHIDITELNQLSALYENILIQMTKQKSTS